MRRLLVGVIVVGLVAVGAYGVYRFVLTPEQQLCRRVEKLCGLDRAGVECEQRVTQLRQGIGEEAFAKTRSCVAAAQSCLGATGCLVGGGLQGLWGLLGGVAAGSGAKDLLEQGRRQLADLANRSGMTPETARRTWDQARQELDAQWERARREAGKLDQDWARARREFDEEWARARQQFEQKLKSR